MRLRNTLIAIVIVLAAAGTGTMAQSAIDGFKPDVNGFVSDVEVGQSRFKYIAGTFTQVNGAPRNALARINHNGSLDTTYNPAPNGGVEDVAIRNN